MTKDQEYSGNHTTVPFLASLSMEGVGPERLWESPWAYGAVAPVIP